MTQLMHVELMCEFAQEQRETQYGLVYLSRIEKDRVFDQDTDGKRVSTMSNEKRKLMAEGIDGVSEAKQAPTILEQDSAARRNAGDLPTRHQS